MIVYLVILAILVLALVIIVVAGIFKSVETQEAGVSQDVFSYKHPRDLYDECIWHINSYISSLDDKPENPSGVVEKVYEALSNWALSKYEEEL